MQICHSGEGRRIREYVQQHLQYLDEYFSLMQNSPYENDGLCKEDIIVNWHLGNTRSNLRYDGDPEGKKYFLHSHPTLESIEEEHMTLRRLRVAFDNYLENSRPDRRGLMLDSY